MSIFPVDLAASRILCILSRSGSFIKLSYFPMGMGVGFWSKPSNLNGVWRPSLTAGLSTTSRAISRLRPLCAWNSALLCSSICLLRACFASASSFSFARSAIAASWPLRDSRNCCSAFRCASWALWTVAWTSSCRCLSAQAASAAFSAPAWVTAISTPRFSYDLIFVIRLPASLSTNLFWKSFITALRFCSATCRSGFPFNNFKSVVKFFLRSCIDALDALARSAAPLAVSCWICNWVPRAVWLWSCCRRPCLFWFATDCARTAESNLLLFFAVGFLECATVAARTAVLALDTWADVLLICFCVAFLSFLFCRIPFADSAAIFENCFASFVVVFSRALMCSSVSDSTLIRSIRLLRSCAIGVSSGNPNLFRNLTDFWYSFIISCCCAGSLRLFTVNFSISFAAIL